MKELFDALRKYFETDFDQWDRWKMNTSTGPVYITFSRYPEPGCNEDSSYDLIAEEKNNG